MKKTIFIKKSEKNNRTGFSMIDVLLAVFVIAIGFVAVMALMGRNLNKSLEARDQMIAVSLAQEGIELVRNLRDNNGFDQFPVSSNENCRIDKDASLDETNMVSCPAFLIENHVLYYKDGFYVHNNSGEATKFKRKVGFAFVNTANPNQNDGSSKVILVSMVIWGGNTFPPEANCNSNNKCAYTKTELINRKGTY